MPDALTIWSTPSPLDLVPGYMLGGMALHSLSHPYPPGLLFGLIFGALIGAIIMSMASGYLIIRTTIARAAGE